VRINPVVVTKLIEDAPDCTHVSPLLITSPFELVPLSISNVDFDPLTVYIADVLVTEDKVDP
jgi:hypothetical protein